MNPETMMTLDDSVDEVLGLLTGLDLTYNPMFDRYRAIARQLNRAMRSNALEHEWSWYASATSVGPAAAGESQVYLPTSLRPRIVGDDSVRLVDENGATRVWAYFLPRDALGKYDSRLGLWVSVTRNLLTFSRPFTEGEDGLDVQIPVMREPRMFRLPKQPEDPNVPLVEIAEEIRNQPIDFNYPDVVILRAAWYYAMTDPVMQPRAQTLESQYKDLMYQIIERDDRNTDTPYQNEFVLPVQGSLAGDGFQHRHPHSDYHERI